MTANYLLILLEISLIASALVSGVFLTFSDFVMKSLAAANPSGGIESMQIINRKVFRTVFMVLLLGMSALSPLWIGAAFLWLSGTAATWVIVGSTIYFVGVFIVSLAFNVPMNTVLDKMDHKSAAAETYWRETYVPRWSYWNSVRSLSSGAAAICYLVAALTLVQL